MIIVELALFLIPMLLGVCVLSAAKLFQDKVTLTTTGAITGLSLFITISYVATVIFPSQLVVLISLFVIALASAIALLLYTPAWPHWRALATDRVGLGVCVALFVLAALLAPKLLFWEEGQLSTSVLNAWGDLAWHMANITSFAEGQSTPPHNPIYAGHRLTYPFLVNFWSGVLYLLGASYVSAVVLPALLLLPLAFMLLYSLSRTITASSIAAVLVVILLFGSGGTLGWTRLGPDLAASGQEITEFLRQLPRDYTGSGGDAQGFHFLNPILSLFLPQRSFLFGMPIAFAILLLLVTAYRDRRPAYYLIAGVLAGTLPLFHGHTVLVMVPLIITVALVDYLTVRRAQAGTKNFWQHWVLFLLVGGIIGIPEVLYYLAGTGSDSSFFRWGPGWTAGKENIAWFWFKNTGLIFPVALTALFLPIPKLAKALAAAAFGIGSIANLYLFAPWPWDNFKLLIFWLIFSLPAVGSALVWFSQRRVFIPLVVLFVIFQTATGFLDLTKTMLPNASSWGEWDKDAITLADSIRQQTPPHSVILTAPYHNNPVALSGRPMYLGFPGHVWSHGEQFTELNERQAAIASFYQGHSATLPYATPQYVIVGPVERQQFLTLVVQPTWQLIAQAGAYELYQIR